MARKAKVAANSEVGTGSESKTLKGSAYSIAEPKTSGIAVTDAAKHGAPYIHASISGKPNPSLFDK